MLEMGRFVSAYSAHREWATRPPDECYDSVPALHAAATRMAVASYEQSTTLPSVVPRNDHVLTLTLPGGSQASFSHWAFGQLCATVGAPAHYLRTLPAQVTAQALNHALARRGRNPEPKLRVLYLVRSTTDDLLPQIRAVTSRRYGRLLNRTITGRVLEWLDGAPSWRLPSADGPDGSQVPSGAYLGDRDMFLCLVDDDRRIHDPSDPSGQGLARGFMLRNSEVGAASLTVDAFLHRYVCGNRVIVGFQHLVGLRLRHVGTRPESWADVFPTLTRWLESDTTQERVLLSRASGREMGGTRDDVVTALVRQGFTRRQAANAYTLAERHETQTNPRSVWGLVQGVTRLAQQASHQDARYELDRLAAGLLRAAA